MSKAFEFEGDEYMADPDLLKSDPEQHPDLVKFRLWLNSGPVSVPAFPHNRRGPLVKHLNDLFDGDAGRHDFLKWAYEYQSIRGLTDSEKWRLWEWLSPQPVDSGDGADTWTIRKQCYVTAAAWKAERVREKVMV